MHVAAYLDRIACRDLSLDALHLAHLRAVPFENLSIHAGERIELTPTWLFHKIVERRRGGFCYELNGLFAELLRALGHHVDLLAARVCRPDGSLGIPFDHMCLRVEVQGRAYLCDVGFGDCFALPVPFAAPAARDGYSLAQDGDGTLLRRGDVPLYRFTLTPYALADFAGGCAHHQTAPESTFTQKRLCSLLTADGRITLRDDRLIEHVGATLRETPIEAEGYRRLLRERFGIDEDVGPAPPT